MASFFLHKGAGHPTTMIQVLKPRQTMLDYVVLEESRKFLLLQSKIGYEVWTKLKDKKGHLIKPKNDQDFYDGPYWFYMKLSNAEKKFAELCRGISPKNCSL